MYDLMGKVALVTGGAQGIGEAIVKTFLEKGAKVLVADINTKLDNTVQTLKKQYGDEKVGSFKLDVVDCQQFEDGIKEAVKLFGGLDILVNNAGICDERDSNWNKMIDVNIKGTINGIKLGLQFMSKEKGKSGGVIINIGSITSYISFGVFPVYASTKSAMIQLTRCYGSQYFYDRTGVKVICVNPGITDTGMTAQAPDIVEDEFARNALMDFWSTYPKQSPSSVSKGILQILRSDFISGSLWTIENNEHPKPVSIQFES